MDYIVLDLEWNQPLSYNSSTYKAVGGKLLFEMIQIGAIRLNNALEITDNFNQLIQPTHYVKLHPRIKRNNRKTDCSRLHKRRPGHLG